MRFQIENIKFLQRGFRVISPFSNSFGVAYMCPHVAYLGRTFLRTFMIIRNVTVFDFYRLCIRFPLSIFSIVCFSFIVHKLVYIHVTLR